MLFITSSKMIKSCGVQSQRKLVLVLSPYARCFTSLCLSWYCPQSSMSSGPCLILNHPLTLLSLFQPQRMVCSPSIYLNLPSSSHLGPFLLAIPSSWLTVPLGFTWLIPLLDSGLFNYHLSVGVLSDLHI